MVVVLDIATARSSQQHNYYTEWLYGCMKLLLACANTLFSAFGGLVKRPNVLFISLTTSATATLAAAARTLPRIVRLPRKAFATSGTFRTLLQPTRAELLRPLPAAARHNSIPTPGPGRRPAGLSTREVTADRLKSAGYATNRWANNAR